MKNNYIKYLLIFVIGGLTFTFVESFASSFLASNIEYKKSDGTVSNVESALNELYNTSGEKIDPANIQQLWVPVGVQTNSFTGTYNFTKKYRYVFVIYFTNSWAGTTYTATNLTSIYYTNNFSRYSEGEEFIIYKDVDTNASIVFSFNGLDRAGISIWGFE